MSKDNLGYVDPFPGRKGSERVERVCGKCQGTGLYSGPTGWTDATGAPFCFACKGEGRSSVLVSSARATARRRAREATVAAERAEQLRTARAAFGAAIADTLAAVREAVERMREGDPLRGDGQTLVWDAEGSAPAAEPWLTDARRWLATLAERAATQRPVPVGRIEVVGTMRARKWVENAYGGTLKMLVEGDGWKVWGSVPAALRDAGAEIGSTVAFTATVEASDDPAFGYFTRPSQARVVEP